LQTPRLQDEPTCEFDAAALYRLMTWMSPAYPVGAFSYSGGIEWAVEAGDIADARIVQKRAAAVGLDPTLFAGHSLRSGYISSAADHGASLQAIADHATHKKLDTTRGYVQVADAFRDHSGKGFL
jgi:urease accessory protein